MAGTRTEQPLPTVSLRPQTVLFTLYGDYLPTTERAVATASVVELLGVAGISEHAARATLKRMATRGLLQRHAAGRQAYFSLTRFGLRTVLDGRERAQAREDMDQAWDGNWTFVAFTLPQEAGQRRHALRSRLEWAGFGMVQGGLWTSPNEIDVVGLLDDLDVMSGVTAFRGEPVSPTVGTSLVASAFDLDRIAERYGAFLARWSSFAQLGRDVNDPLLFRLVMSADWLLALRGDPRLPSQFLPPDWPGSRARTLHHQLESRWREAAEQEAHQRLATRPTR